MTNWDQTKSKVLSEINDKLTALSTYQKFNQLEFVYPETGPYARSFYPDHMKFMEAGKDHRFRMLSGGNGSGKSYTMGYEIALHVTGNYPEWWKGKKLVKPETIWIVAETGALWRDSLQKLLFGRAGEEVGTGFIPKDRIVDHYALPGVPGAIGSALVKHKKGHVVSVILKTFDQKRESLQAANVSLVAFDEEPPEDVYGECVMRTRGTKTREPGIVMLAFTPLKGLTEVVLKYLPNGMFPENGLIPEEPEKYVCRIPWDAAPHLTESDKAAMLSEIPMNLRDARTKGIPALGSGRVYPISEEDIIVNHLKIAPHWPRCFGLDFGWNKTAAIWGAKDPETGILYLYGEYYQGNLAPYAHTHAIQQRGKWIPGICDPRGDKSSERDGSKLIDEYTSLGLELTSGDNAIQSGIARVLNLMESGLLKITYNCENWLKEFRTYRYDTKDPNKIARNQADHLLDAARYLVSRFDDVSVSASEIQDELEKTENPRKPPSTDVNPVTGY